ncbi:hypothetical protein P691DRAFT_811279 [Macrolepiota fuliginosa MF-IS2]|uniref:Nephrocystin 3-like N-terminal domain-containing protein n=1 Tax=Macrolepiota fuliginosa MF-IS2 TaxID=1400762 RepID=A0A9P6C2X7_9AGAR|nr:hypothetical protein P691DRAFT_811279 [Macrolepiota fuliginosa MF-IS2]
MNQFRPSKHDTVMEYLSRNRIRDAEFDSPPWESPQCHPGTQRNVIDSIHSFILCPSRQRAGLVWMYGRAAVGKSVSLQTLSAELRDDLAATFFFPRSGICRSSRQILLTVAHQLAIRYPLYHSYLDGCMRRVPEFLEKRSETLFETLFIIPTLNNLFCIQPDHHHVIVIDGLNFQDNPQEQPGFCKLVHHFVLNHPTGPFVWIISGRPEEHLHVRFSQIRITHSSYKEVELDPNSQQARADVKSYLRDGFNNIRDYFHDATPPRSESWPAPDQFLKVASASLGFFPFASEILNFIDQSTLGGPVSRLDHVLTLLDDPGLNTTLPPNLFHSLDNLYSSIMSGVPASELPVIHSLLGFYTVPHIHGNTSFQLACNILHIERHVAYSVLRGLRSSVLSLPSPSNARIEMLKFVHKSFPDYLRNPQRSSPHTLSMDSTLVELWKCHTRVVLQWLVGRSTDGIKIYWSPEEPSQLTARSLKEEIFERSSSCWPVILHRHCHRWCSNSCQQKFRSQASLDIPSSNVMAFLKQIDFGCPALFGKDPTHMLNVLKWIQHTRLELRNQLILEEFPLARLDPSRFFAGLREKKWYRGLTERSAYLETKVEQEYTDQILSADFCGSHWKIVKNNLMASRGRLGDLVRLLEGNDMKGATVTLFGTSLVNCCGLIQHNISPSEIQYHLFPYLGTENLVTISADLISLHVLLFIYLLILRVQILNL